MTKSLTRSRRRARREGSRVRARVYSRDQLEVARNEEQGVDPHETAARKRPAAEVVREALRETPYPIVLDDFHYLTATVKKSVARAVKTLIGTTRVILIAVPHEAFEVVRSEPEMNARVWQQKITPWSVSELEFIAREGFKALNITDNAHVGRALAEASYGAPFLMQQLCYDFATSQAVWFTAPHPVDAVPPDSWEAFFRRVADRSTPGVFDKLRKGPNPRGQQRIDRVLNDGRVTDIYGAILYGISKSGKKATIGASDLTRTLEQVIKTNAPQRQQLVASLGHLKDIAFEARGSSVSGARLQGRGAAHPRSVPFVLPRARVMGTSEATRLVEMFFQRFPRCYRPGERSRAHHVTSRAAFARQCPGDSREMSLSTCPSVDDQIFSKLRPLSGKALTDVCQRILVIGVPGRKERQYKTVDLEQRRGRPQARSLKIGSTGYLPHGAERVRHLTYPEDHHRAYSTRSFARTVPTRW